MQDYLHMFSSLLHLEILDNVSVEIDCSFGHKSASEHQLPELVVENLPTENSDGFDGLHC